MPRRRLRLLSRDTLVGRVAWLIGLRWLAVIGLAITTLVAALVVNLRRETWMATIIIGIFIAAYNLLLHIKLQRLRKYQSHNVEEAAYAARRMAGIQIVADLICLTILIICSGGILNPIGVFMVFHVAIAGIILPRRDAYGVAAFAWLLYIIIGLVGLVLPSWRVPLDGFVLEKLASSATGDLVFVTSVCMSMGFTFVLISYFTGGISSRLKDVYEQLSASNDQLMRHDEEKTALLKIIAHQLRSPLGAVVSLVDMVDPTTMSSDKQTELSEILTRVRKRCDRMMDLIDDLLLLTRLQEGLIEAEERRPVNLVDEILETVEGFEPQAIDKNLDLEVDLQRGSYEVVAGRRDIQDMVGNLVSNAIKYTQQGSVQVQGRYANGTYEIRVSDTGIGIPARDQEQLFTEFFRAGNARKMEAHSSGLGLNIAREIAHRLEGDITFESTEGEGTTFIIQLPVRLAHKRDTSSAESADPA